MNVYKCDFCGKVFEDVELEIDLPSSFYDDVIEDINAVNKARNEKPTTAAKLAKKAGRIYLGVGLEGESAGSFSYDACPACFVKIVQGTGKRR